MGPPALWPRSLKTATRILLTSRQPFWIGWGPELTYLYNDPYKAIIGQKHPNALGKPFREVWGELWDVVGPMADGVMKNDTGTYVEAQQLIMERHGYQEETYYTFSYSPIPNDDGGPGGLICANTDNTRHVIGERQLASLRELAVRTTHARNWRDACVLSVDALAQNVHDVPFVLAFAHDETLLSAANANARNGTDGTDTHLPQQSGWKLIAASGDTGALADDNLWPLQQVVTNGEASFCPLPREAAATGKVPTGVWTRAPEHIAMLPIGGLPQRAPRVVLVLGLNPFRKVDESYRGFLQLAARQVEASLSNAEAYEQERLRAESLARLDEAKTTFFSNVSHEFRTPLTLLLGPLEDLLSKPQPLPEADRIQVEVAHRNALRLLKLVNSLLDFSRIEAGRSNASFEPTDLSSYTADLASLFRSAFERAEIALIVDCPSLNAPVHVDRGMWEKIVLNLLSNAFKYTFSGSIRVCTRSVANHAVLTVSDTGTGIPAHELPHLFERFHRVEGARGRTFEGSGIGLALVNELVKLHGGTVSVESEVDQGTSFHVRLPFGVQHLPKDRVGVHPDTGPPDGRGRVFVEEVLGWLPGEDHKPSQPPAPDALNGYSFEASAPRAYILLADDNADMREYVRRLLAPQYEVVTVNDGAAALAAARSRRPDLVLADIMMPELDGFGLLQALRAYPPLRDVPVILLSARAGEEARVEGLQSGADDYLVKPFSARELLARVSARLELSRHQAHARAELERSEQELREEAQALEALNRIGRTLVAELDLQRLLQAVTDLATQVSGAQYGAFAYSKRNGAGVEVPLQAVSGPVISLFADIGASAHNPLLGPVLRGESSLRYADISSHRGLIESASRHGLIDRFPVRSYLAVPVVSRTGDVLGGLFFGHPNADVFTERSERLAIGIAAQAAVAIDNAHLYDQRRQLIERLRDNDRRKDEFLATLSHELRNPLAPLSNALHLLRHQYSEDLAASPLVKLMERQVAHLVRLVDDLLEMSRITQGTLELRKEQVEVQTVINSALEASRPLLDANRHELSVSLPDAPLWVEGDAVRLAQIISNLVNNAAKYTNPEGRIEVSASADAETCEITVADNGIGISEHALPRLFEMFSRGDHATGRGPGGLGVGLALAHRLAQLHQGTVTATSPGPGKGSTFTLRLARSAGTENVETTRELQPILASARVLVVDDNEDAAESMGMLLELLGVDARIASDGMQALEVAQSYEPELILLDIGLPDIDGYEVARRIRASPSAPQPMLVALTGWGQHEDQVKAREAGFDHHMVKPADLEAVRVLLNSVTARSELASS